MGGAGGIGADNQGVRINHVQADNENKRSGDSAEREVFPVSRAGR